ncbi:copper-containing nitrite reductase [Puniceibacterium sediminis]|uniref:Copper-containing nitrite reductase n=1 Tax=Puniceibacterium sediminis TaxID=1608407 RepID=A0A238YPH2_9RHOB|nr:copper-containing nitrite reductase [Puniceibacterium sediminis]SNR73037.1 dissimilatory nitrite reductase (NO-forming), copper type apoprotein [Puniceibacterium sediminis]
MTRHDDEKLQSPGRRNVLRGSALAGAAALTGSFATATAATAAARTPFAPPRITMPGAEMLRVKQQINAAEPVDLSGYERVTQTLVRPPFAPKHDQVAQGAPKIVEIEMVVDERLMVVDEDTGASIGAMTYNGSVPGPLIIVHQDDYVELTLKSLSRNALEHNIDFHASTGALGGGALTHIYPGEETVLRFKATKPGCFTYHCAPGGAMIPYHVCHGMNGAIMVLPRDGLKDKDGNALTYDEIAYIGEQDYYLPRNEDGTFKTYSSDGDDYAESLEAMRTLTPSHVVFNGAVGALTGANALRSAVGKTVLMIHNQANRDSRPHLIGGHGNVVWESGSFSDAPMTGMETWFVRGGSAMAAMYTFEQPGVYAYVNHNVIEAAILGATAHFVVDGDWNNALMEQVVAPRSTEA